MDIMKYEYNHFSIFVSTLVLHNFLKNEKLINTKNDKNPTIFDK